MICRNCGTQFDDGGQFCPVCGAKAVNENPETFNPDTSVSSTSVMIWGIVAAALAETGIPGLIVSIIALGKSRRYAREGGLVCGKAKAGRILSKVGLGLSIGFIVFWTLYVILFVALFALAGTGAGVLEDILEIALEY